MRTDFRLRDVVRQHLDELKLVLSRQVTAEALAPLGSVDDLVFASGCPRGCSGGCSGNCSGSCSGSCRGDCTGSCSGCTGKSCLMQ